MKKGVITFLLISILVILSIVILIHKINLSNNNSSIAKSTVNYLCSYEVNDREYKTEGNKKVTDYLNSLYTKLDLEYVFGNSYLEEFDLYPSKINNVVGKINGRNNKLAIVLTAHFDAWCNGALDNASGVATVLEIASNLKNFSSENTLNYDVIFCLTNAEMAGFEGSKKFIEEINGVYDNIYNINIDCVGAKAAGPLALKNISRIPESGKLYSSIKEAFSEHNIEFVDDFATEKVKTCYEQGFGVSDYFSFEKNMYPNIHICQQNISGLILNESDKPNLLDFSEIEKLAEVISLYIENLNLE